MYVTNPCDDHGQVCSHRPHVNLDTPNSPPCGADSAAWRRTRHTPDPLLAAARTLPSPRLPSRRQGSGNGGQVARCPPCSAGPAWTRERTLGEQFPKGPISWSNATISGNSGEARFVTKTVKTFRSDEALGVR